MKTIGFAFVLAVLVGLAAPAVAAPAALICLAPKSLFCADCATQITFRAGADGKCRIAKRSGDKAAAPPGYVRIRLEAPMHPWRRPLAPVAGPTRDRCFVFRDRRYCE